MHTSYICDLTSHMWGASLLLAPHSFGLSVVVSYRVSGPPLQSQVAARRSELRIHSCVSYTGELTCVCPCTQWLELTQTHTHDTHTQVTLTAVSSPSRDSPLSCDPSVSYRYHDSRNSCAIVRANCESAHTGLYSRTFFTVQ